MRKKKKRRSSRKEEGGRGVVQQINFISGLSTPLLKEKQRIIKEDKKEERRGAVISRRAGRREKRFISLPLSDVVNVCVLYVGEIGVTQCEDDYVFKTACEYVWPLCI